MKEGFVGIEENPFVVSEVRALKRGHGAGK
jgi:hypothetical protein